MTGKVWPSVSRPPSALSTRTSASASSSLTSDRVPFGSLLGVPGARPPRRSPGFDPPLGIGYFRLLFSIGPLIYLIERPQGPAIFGYFRSRFLRSLMLVPVIVAVTGVVAELVIAVRFV